MKSFKLRKRVAQILTKVQWCNIVKFICMQKSQEQVFWLLS